MYYQEEDYLMLSGIQHFLFCRRQWALIHIEQQWAENVRTVEGAITHKNAHDAGLKTRRGDILTIRALRVHSAELGFSGECDVVEFRQVADGIPLIGEEGLWVPYPVEYKRGSPKKNLCDEAQLCAQAMCLEEMLCCQIPEGALYYGEKRRRHVVELTSHLRETVRDAAEEMHRLYTRGYTPKVKPSKSCGACSLKDLCLPELMRRSDVRTYMMQEGEIGQ